VLLITHGVDIVQFENKNKKSGFYDLQIKINFEIVHTKISFLHNKILNFKIPK